jgi:hypothetical protein
LDHHAGWWWRSGEECSLSLSLAQALSHCGQLLNGGDDVVRYWGFGSACAGDPVLVVMLALTLGSLSLVIFIMLVAMPLLVTVILLAVMMVVGLHC